MENAKCSDKTISKSGHHSNRVHACERSTNNVLQHTVHDCDRPVNKKCMTVRHMAFCFTYNYKDAVFICTRVNSGSHGTVLKLSSLASEVFRCQAITNNTMDKCSDYQDIIRIFVL